MDSGSRGSRAQRGLIRLSPESQQVVSESMVCWAGMLLDRDTHSTARVDQVWLWPSLSMRVEKAHGFRLKRGDVDGLTHKGEIVEDMCKQTWLEAMHGKHLVSIIIDQDLAIYSAVT
ncbi:hypothetical protein AKJ16_DCAP06107 [Drosera capensis]